MSITPRQFNDTDRLYLEGQARLVAASSRNHELIDYMKPAYEIEANGVFYQAALRAVSGHYLEPAIKAGELPSKDSALDASGDLAHLYILARREYKDFSRVHVESGCHCRRLDHCATKTHMQALLGYGDELLFASMMVAARADGAESILAASSAYDDFYGGSEAHDFVYYEEHAGILVPTKIQLTSDSSAAKFAAYDQRRIAFVNIKELFGNLSEEKDIAEAFYEQQPDFEAVTGMTVYATQLENYIENSRVATKRFGGAALGSFSRAA